MRGYIIPTCLNIDRCPISGADGPDAIWIVHEPVPGIGAGLDDFVVARPNTARELVGAEVFPDGLNWIALTSMDTCAAKQQEQFLGRVNSRLSRWR